jgi:hypothetical protein
MNLDNFNWGPTSERFKKQVTEEIFNGTNDYEKLFEVEEGDIITFPSFLKHESKPNMIDLPKVSIAFNVDTEISPTLLPQIK